MVKKVLIPSFCIGIFLLFQNCAKTNLEELPIKEDLHHHEVLIDTCFTGDIENYSLDGTLALSLGMIPDQYYWSRDSDFDGLSDKEEELYGFNPFLRRSSGKILDSLCLKYTNTNDCSNLNLTCQNLNIGFGFTDCDAELAGLGQFDTNPQKGIDADRDGILDYIEILRGLNPLVYDSHKDPDNDKKSNLDEILSGGNPYYYEENFDSSFQPIYQFEKVTDPNCSGEKWILKISHIPWLPSLETIFDEDNSHSNTNPFPLSSEKNDSLLLISIKLKPKDIKIETNRFYVKLITLKKKTSSTHLQFSEFNLLGEVKR